MEEWEQVVPLPDSEGAQQYGSPDEQEFCCWELGRLQNHGSGNTDDLVVDAARRWWRRRWRWAATWNSHDTSDGDGDEGEDASELHIDGLN